MSLTTRTTTGNPTPQTVVTSRLEPPILLATRIQQQQHSDDRSCWLTPRFLPNRPGVSGSNTRHDSLSRATEQPLSMLYSAARSVVAKVGPLHPWSESSTNTTISPSRRTIPMLPLTKERSWELLEDELLILLNGQQCKLGPLRQLHHSSIVRNPTILKSIAYLSTRGDLVHEDGQDFEHLLSLSSYLSVGRLKREYKVQILRTLLLCAVISNDRKQQQAQIITDSEVNEVMDFLTRRDAHDTRITDFSDMSLLWELRAMCLRQIELQQERVANVTKTGDSFAVMISVTAKLVEQGMTKTVQITSNHMENVGKQVKGNLKANDYPLMVDRNAVVALAFSDAAKRSSEGVHEWTKVAVKGIRDTTSCGLQTIVNGLDEERVGQVLSQECIEAMKAAGKIGMATIGAVVIVGEALLESSRVLLQTATVVTADVVQHKYGTSAGQVVSDAGETAVNICRTLGNVTVVMSTTTAEAVASSAARSTAKDQVNLEANNATEMLTAFENQVASYMRHALDYSPTIGQPARIESV